MKAIIVYGATSAIAQATIRLLAERGSEMFLVGRDDAKLKAVASDATVRGCKKISTLACDLNDTARHRDIFNQALAEFPQIETLLIAHGSLPDQERCNSDFNETLLAIETNYLSAVSILLPWANHFEKQKSGTLAVITSVAGDRGRKRNYVYGSAKAALNVFLAGLRNRLASSNVHVLDIKPGFVDTPMTAQFKKGPLFASPQTVARGIVNALDQKKDVVYLPWFWRWIMLVIRSIPEPIFKRMSL